jgi:hypothetical protein
MVRCSAGTRLGTYDLISRVGVSGMREMYKSRDTRLGRIQNVFP